MRSIWRRNSIAVSLGTGCFFSGASTATGSAFFFTDMARTALSLPMNANGARYHAPDRAGKGATNGVVQKEPVFGNAWWGSLVGAVSWE